MNLAAGHYEAVVSHFERAEAAGLPVVTARFPSIVAVGSVAEKALASPLLRKQLKDRGVELRELRPHADVDELARWRDWSLGLILSPYKQTVQELCDDLTESARRSGVVDTILQDASGKRFGINTNAYGAAHAVWCLMGGARPERCLIAGTGASARSCVVGLRELYGDLEIGMVGRSPDRAFEIAKEFSVALVEEIGDYTPDLVINTTTVGETRDDKLQFPLEKALYIGTRYFDLNNRTSALQVQALELGCVTLSGVLMQSVVNALRVHLLVRSN